MTLREASTAGDASKSAFRGGVVSLRRAQELLANFQQIALLAPPTLTRALGPAAGRNTVAKHDGDILHIIKQYPGCSDAQVLAFLRARVHWFGRGTWIGKVFRPSLGTVHAAGRRLDAAGEIKTKVDRSQHHQALRFYPNTPLWSGTATDDSLR